MVAAKWFQYTKNSTLINKCVHQCVIGFQVLGFSEPDHTFTADIFYIPTQCDSAQWYYHGASWSSEERKIQKSFDKQHHEDSCKTDRLDCSWRCFFYKSHSKCFFLYMHLVSHSHNSLCVSSGFSILPMDSYSSLHVQARSKPPTFQPTLWATATPCFECQHRVIDLLIFSFQHISKPLQFYLYRAKSVQQLSEGTLHYKWKILQRTLQQSDDRTRANTYSEKEKLPFNCDRLAPPWPMKPHVL